MSEVISTKSCIIDFTHDFISCSFVRGSNMETFTFSCAILFQVIHGKILGIVISQSGEMKN